MVLAEYSWEAGMVIPRRVYRRSEDDIDIFWASFTYVIGWIGIIGSTIPGTEN